MAGYAGVPSRADLERVFFLDDEDRALIDQRRGEHMRLGFALQLVTVRWVGAFLEDPLDVPVVVLDFVAEQLGIADPSCVKRYTERPKTKLDHQWEIRRVFGLKEFTAVEGELRAWVAALGADGLVPPRRLAELAKYGMSADASQIRRHRDGRRLATLLATVRHLEAKSVDDTLELLDLLMATELLNKAQMSANKETVRRHPKLAAPRPDSCPGRRRHRRDLRDGRADPREDLLVDAVRDRRPLRRSPRPGHRAVGPP